ncbi:MAG: hypothetical protein IPJ13_15380 [Saprospiraceae bacterium]|nr:hypothetical protein [Saprospiraceae bacterium]
MAINTNQDMNMKSQKDEYNNLKSAVETALDKAFARLKAKAVDTVDMSGYFANISTESIDSKGIKASG